MPVPEYQRVEMDKNFHDYVRHLVECGDREGQLTEKLTTMRDEIAASLPEEMRVDEDAVTTQQRLHLAYLDGYLEGPGAAAVDLNYDRYKQQKHERARRRKLPR